MVTSGRTGGAWVVVAPVPCLRTLRPLIRAHERARPVRVVELPDGSIPPAERWPDWLRGAEGALLIGNRRFSPRSALPGPFLADDTGRRVPVGWLPDAGENGLATFARVAARVLQRGEAATLGPVALLGQWQPRYLALVERMAANLHRDGTASPPVYRWTADRITRDDLARALGTGLGLAIYFGHGRPGGWAGYHGLRARHLTVDPGEPAGAILSMTCRTASRWGVGLSFSEAIVLGGVAAAAVGAVAPVDHLLNMRWMLGLCDALGDGDPALGPVLAEGAPASDRAGSAYRIIGDPLAALAGAPLAAIHAGAIWAPAPDERIA